MLVFLAGVLAAATPASAAQDFGTPPGIPEFVSIRTYESRADPVTFARCYETRSQIDGRQPRMTEPEPGVFEARFNRSWSSYVRIEASGDGSTVSLMRRWTSDPMVGERFMVRECLALIGDHSQNDVGAIDLAALARLIRQREGLAEPGAGAE